jgi:thioredoxin reductase (NADPH)
VSEPDRLTVAVLCAAWCTTCKAFEAAVARIAVARPEVRLLWFDVEDDSDVCGDIDVENFPTLAVFRGGDLLHFGTSLPQEPRVLRLIDEMADPRRPAMADAPREVVALADHLDDDRRVRAACN